MGKISASRECILLSFCSARYTSGGGKRQARSKFKSLNGSGVEGGFAIRVALCVCGESSRGRVCALLMESGQGKLTMQAAMCRTRVRYRTEKMSVIDYLHSKKQDAERQRSILRSIVSIFSLGSMRSTAGIRVHSNAFFTATRHL